MGGERNDCLNPERLIALYRENVAISNNKLPILHTYYFVAKRRCSKVVPFYTDARRVCPVYTV